MSIYYIKTTIMKSQIKSIIFILFVGIFLAACAGNKNANANTITGVVQDIQNGKDGYTAQIKTANNEIYYATISHGNLTDHSQYRTVQVGETIEVAGDQWDMEGKKQITVRKLYPKE